MAMGRPREFDKERVLDEAMEVFWRHGYEGTTIAELTAAMGINPPSLYAAFGSKEGLLKAALDHYSAKRAEFMREVLAAPTARKVTELLLLRIADLQTDPANPPGCLLVAGGLACGAGAENVPFELASRRAQTEEQLRDRFVRAKNGRRSCCRGRPGGIGALCFRRDRRHGSSCNFRLRPRRVATGRPCLPKGVRRARGCKKIAQEQRRAGDIRRQKLVRYSP